MIGQTPWRSEFDEHGGYDCITPAYTIRDAEGRKLFVVDFKEFNGDCENPGEEARKIVLMIEDAISAMPAPSDEFKFTCPNCGGHQFGMRARDACSPKLGQITYCTTDRAKCQWSSGKG